MGGFYCTTESHYLNHCPGTHRGVQKCHKTAFVKIYYRKMPYFSITQQVHIHKDHYRPMCEKTKYKRGFKHNKYLLYTRLVKTSSTDMFLIFNHSSIGVYLATVNMYGWSILFFFFVLSQHFFFSHACTEPTLSGYDPVLW